MIRVKTVKKTDPEVEMIADWLANDPDHQKSGIKIEDVFEENTETALIYDEEGPIMIVRFHKALRAAIQFNPKTRLRNARAGKEVVEWFRQLAVAAKCKEIIVRPGGKARKFAKRLGFKSFIGRFIGV